MEWLETTPIPAECQHCTEEDCYNCDITGKRWILSRKDELHTNRMGITRTIERLKKRIAAIDKELEKLDNE